MYLPPVESSRGGEYYISTIRANIGRSTGRSTPHRVISSGGNSTFLLLELILADQLADLPPPVRVIFR